VVEKIDKGFVREVLNELPQGVVVVSGTNGKTTTTKMVVELLQSQGLKVFTNGTGSNFVRGVIASLLEVVDKRGRLDADIAVLELDEAHAVKFVEIVKPRYSLLLNVQEDQVDRFGGVEGVAKKLWEVAEATTEAVVVNREDTFLRRVQPQAEVVYYGLDKRLLPEFFDAGEVSGEQSVNVPTRLVLSSIKGKRVEYKMGNKVYSTTMAMEGIYNAYNAAGALTLVSVILPKISIGDLLKPLSKVASAYGRGESLIVGGKEVKLILVKNASGLRLSLQSFNSRKYKVAMAINNAPADGQDVTWLAKVDFSVLDRVELVGGAKGAEVAEWIREDGVKVDRVAGSLGEFAREVKKWDEPTYVFANYTALFKIRRLLVK